MQVRDRGVTVSRRRLWHHYLSAQRRLVHVVPAAHVRHDVDKECRVALLDGDSCPIQPLDAHDLLPLPCCPAFSVHVAVQLSKTSLWPVVSVWAMPPPGKRVFLKRSFSISDGRLRRGSASATNLRDNRRDWQLRQSRRGAAICAADHYAAHAPARGGAGSKALRTQGPLAAVDAGGTPAA